MVRQSCSKAHQLRGVSAVADSTGDSTAGKCPASISTRRPIGIRMSVGTLMLILKDGASRHLFAVA